MQLLEDDCKDTKEQQTNITTLKEPTDTATKQKSTQHKMDKFYPPKPKINAFNELFTCHLCHGYMINPTTIDVCSHTYCRSCIARHLAVDCYCPQCGKPITTTNLQADDILRSIIYKLVPGLYQKERERLVQFVNNTKNEGNLIGASEESLNQLLEQDDDLFSPTDPISLSLEFHPVLAEQCPEGSVPPIRYLQCPASVKVQHLKRFLCSKFEIDPSNRQVGIDIIYEDEILPSDFTLMDVGYCYKWQRNAPLRLTYRILIYNEENLTPPSDRNLENTEKSKIETITKTVSFADEKTQISETSDKELQKHTKVKSSKSSASKHASNPQTNTEVPVKVTISRKSTENKKSVSKKSSSMDEFVMPTTTTNDFKSLRSNDIRFSDYAITSSTTSNNSTPLANNSLTMSKKEKSLAVKEEKSVKCDIVVSIPHNQMQEEWESKPLSHLKTASKKSPSSSGTEQLVNPVPVAKKVRNVPKLKIELNSLKTKLIEKPKSADIRLDTLLIKQHRPRKFSLDEPQPIMDKVDLETYVKNIGLKPIEVATYSAAAVAETPDKFTPNASPMSSSSSTTSSSTGNFNFGNAKEKSSSSSHKKRKKKHSKDSRDSKDSKRKKMHAEISSHSAEESLKMKVKLTPNISYKSNKFESKKSPPFVGDKNCDPLALEKLATVVSGKDERKEVEKLKITDIKSHERFKDKNKLKSSESKKLKILESKLSLDVSKSKPLEIKIASSNNSTKSQTKDFDDDEDLIIHDTNCLGLTKPLANIKEKETKLPHSPPLPPSLFKTTPLTFSTFSPNVTTVAKTKPLPITKDFKEKSKSLNIKPIAPKPIAAKPPNSLTQFVVPNPPRFTAGNNKKFPSTPTSIASEANKHMSNMLKRSISLDDNKNSNNLSKQFKLEKPNQITVSAYVSNSHMTKVEIPATPTSSTAKATYEIPLYSPLSAAYNPKCSFSVNSTSTVATTAVKNTKPIQENPMTSNKANKLTFSTTTTNSNNKTEVPTTKPLATSNTTTTTTLMGPPLQKLNTTLTVVPTAVKSPPLSTVLPFASSTSSTSLPVTKTNQQSSIVNSTYLNSPLSMVNYRQSKVLLAHVKPTNLPELKLEKPLFNTTTTTTKTIENSTNGLASEKPKSSLRQFRLPSRESGQDILDLSANTKTSTNGLMEMSANKSLTSPLSPATSSTSTSNSLEMALNKIKQNMTTTTTNANVHAPSANTAVIKDQIVKKQELLSPIADDLQNLHLLSESATAREKIAISTSTTTTASSISSSTSCTTSLYEKAKITQNSLVRQQNASVRNIPNPSALAFRNQQPTTILPPMVTIAAGVATSLSNDLDKPLLLKTPSPPKSPHSPNCSTTSSSTSPSRHHVNKKHPSIDQVAASLNQRASAAAEASAKALNKLSDETSLVSSTSCSLNEHRLEKQEIKQETTEIMSTQSETATSVVQPSSTVNSCPALVNVLEIKKEPEEKLEESSNDTKPSFINASIKKSSMVENLVTSVINVTTPTPTLLTATTAAGF